MNVFGQKSSTPNNVQSVRQLARMTDVLRPQASYTPTPYVSDDYTPPIEPKTTEESPWGTARAVALVFLIVSSLLTLFSLRTGLPARETGLLCALSAVAASVVLYGIPLWQTYVRGTLALSIAGFASLSTLILLPALNLWPVGGGPLLFSLIFAIVGTLTRSRACLSLALVALFALMIDSDGLTRMRLDAQIATLGLFSIGLCGSVMAGSRIIAGVSLVAVMGATLTLMATFGIPTPGALAVLSVFAIATAITLRAYLLRGYEAAELPMIVSFIVFALSAIAFQLNLMGDFSPTAERFATALPNLGVMILIAIQGMVLFVSLVGWLARRSTLADVMLVQAMFGLVCTVIADPMRLSRLGIGDPSLVLTALIGLIVGSLAVMTLKRAWREDRPVVTSLSALVVMIQLVFGMRLLLGNFDVALAALVCAGIAVCLAALMLLNPRNNVPDRALS